MIDLESTLAAVGGAPQPAEPFLVVAIGDHDVELALGEASQNVRRWRFSVGVATLRDDELAHDPPRPEELTNAIGRVIDHLDDAVREHPAVMGATTVVVAGRPAATVAAVEIGRYELDELTGFVLRRDAAEDVFRTLATEARADRAHNPGLQPDDVDLSVAACCTVVALMRRLELDDVVVTPTWVGARGPGDAHEAHP